jgi:glucose-1-phosphate thymidylyltransferase
VASRLAEFKSGCELFLKKVHDPERFGVPTLDGEKIVRVTEKPSNPDSEYAVTGLYVYDEKLFEYIERLKPSARGEYEVTDISNIYLEESTVKANFLKDDWLDAGTFESLYRANEMVRARILNGDRKSYLQTKQENSEFSKTRA